MKKAYYLLFRYMVRKAQAKFNADIIGIDILMMSHAGNLIKKRIMPDGRVINTI